MLNKYATSDEIGLIFCIHGLYFISDRTFSPFTRSFVLLLNLRWWNWSLVDSASLVLERVFLQSVLCKWNNLINLKSLFLILIYLSWTISTSCQMTSCWETCFMVMSRLNYQNNWLNEPRYLFKQSISKFLVERNLKCSVWG